MNSCPHPTHRPAWKSIPSSRGGDRLPSVHDHRVFSATSVMSSPAAAGVTFVTGWVSGVQSVAADEGTVAFRSSASPKCRTR